MRTPAKKGALQEKACYAWTSSSESAGVCHELQNQMVKRFAGKGITSNQGFAIGKRGACTQKEPSLPVGLMSPGSKPHCKTGSSSDQFSELPSATLSRLLWSLTAIGRGSPGCSPQRPDRGEVTRQASHFAGSILVQYWSQTLRAWPGAQPSCPVDSALLSFFLGGKGSPLNSTNKRKAPILLCFYFSHHDHWAFEPSEEVRVMYPQTKNRRTCSRGSWKTIFPQQLKALGSQPRRLRGGPGWP